MCLTTELQINDANTDTIDGRNIQFNNSSWRLQCLAYDNGQNKQREVNKEIEDLNNTLSQVPLTDMHRTIHPTACTHSFKVHVEHSPG